MAVEVWECAPVVGAIHMVGTASDVVYIVYMVVRIVLAAEPVVDYLVGIFLQADMAQVVGFESEGFAAVAAVAAAVVALLLQATCYTVLLDFAYVLLALDLDHLVAFRNKGNVHNEQDTILYI
jgi:hypothetical protein